MSEPFYADIIIIMRIIKFSAAILLIFISLSCITNPEKDYEIDSGRPAGGQNQEFIQNAVNASSSDTNEAEKRDQESKPPAIDAIIPPLSNTAFKAKVQSMMPWNMKSVMDGKSPLVIIHDLDKNGYNDALVVAVAGDDEIKNQLSELSKTVRLFTSDTEYIDFLLLIFYQYEGEVILRYTVPVSRKQVFEGIRPFEIRRGSDFPYAIEFSFRTRAGIEKEIIILSGYGITNFTVKENLSEITLIQDIDDDGYQDMIVHEQGFEEGAGFETFITWYKWNLREYTEYRSTNIVRNLRQFYIVCAEFLRAGDYEDFLDYALDSKTLSKLKRQGKTNIEIIEEVFSPAVETSEDGWFFESDSFSAVVFPEIMETPFSYAKRNNFSHKVSVRFRKINGESRIFLAELKMKKNPFQDRQFCFCTNNLR